MKEWIFLASGTVVSTVALFAAGAFHLSFAFLSIAVFFFGTAALCHDLRLGQKVWEFRQADWDSSRLAFGVIVILRLAHGAIQFVLLFLSLIFFLLAFALGIEALLT